MERPGYKKPTVRITDGLYLRIEEVAEEDREDFKIGTVTGLLGADLWKWIQQQPGFDKLRPVRGDDIDLD